MSLKAFVSAICVGALLCMNLEGQIVPEQKDISRDLSKYHTLGPLVLGYTPELKNAIEERFSEIRKFIWESFSNHVYAHVSYTAFSREGAKSDFSIFVEPDIEGNWRIHSEIKRQFTDYSPERKTVQESQEYDAYKVIRIIKHGFGKDPRILSDSDPASANEYELRLLDKTGKRLTDI